jgi:hypothetical protein
MSRADTGCITAILWTFAAVFLIGLSIIKFGGTGLWISLALACLVTSLYFYIRKSKRVAKYGEELSEMVNLTNIEKIDEMQKLGLAKNGEKFTHSILASLLARKNHTVLMMRVYT